MLSQHIFRVVLNAIKYNCVYLHNSFICPNANRRQTIIFHGQSDHSVL